MWLFWISGFLVAILHQTGSQLSCIAEKDYGNTRPDFSDCSKYFLCIPLGQWHHMSCAQGSMFDRAAGECRFLKGKNFQVPCSNSKVIEAVVEPVDPTVIFYEETNDGRIIQSQPVYSSGTPAKRPQYTFVFPAKEASPPRTAGNTWPSQSSGANTRPYVNNPNPQYNVNSQSSTILRPSFQYSKPSQNTFSFSFRPQFGDSSPPSQAQSYITSVSNSYRPDSAHRPEGPSQQYQSQNYAASTSYRPESHNRPEGPPHQSFVTSVSNSYRPNTDNRPEGRPHSFATSVSDSYRPDSGIRPYQSPNSNHPGPPYKPQEYAQPLQNPPVSNAYVSESAYRPQSGNASSYQQFNPKPSESQSAKPDVPSISINVRPQTVYSISRPFRPVSSVQTTQRPHPESSTKRTLLEPVPFQQDHRGKEDYSVLPEECGRRIEYLKVDRVHGGVPVSIESFPWQAGLKHAPDGRHFCGATIISKKFVLSAAHCFILVSRVTDVIVRVGDTKLKIVESYERDYAVERLYIHKKFKSKEHNRNDIALLKLKGVLEFNVAVQPACLPKFGLEVIDNDICAVSGWGATELSSRVSDVLMATAVPIVSRSQCMEYHKMNISMSMFCAGKEGVDTCKGDSGGPLVCRRGKVFFLHGITSWGVGCGVKDKPGMYIMVSMYRQWIEAKMKLSSPDSRLVREATDYHDQDSDSGIFHSLRELVEYDDADINETY